MILEVTYDYNLQDRLETVATDDGTTETIAEYEYDANGVRIKQTVTVDAGTPVETEYLIDSQNPTGYAKPIREIVDGTVETDYTLGHQIISQQNASGEPLFFIHDGHGSTRILLDDTASVEATYHYDAFGNAHGFDAATALTSWLFAGDGQYDQAAGLTYHLDRWRDGQFFLTLDAFYGNPGDPQSFHKVLYAHADPINGTDPTGMFTSIGVAMAGSIRSMVTGAYGGAAAGIFAGATAIDEGIGIGQSTFGLILDELMGPIDWGVSVLGAALDFTQWLYTKGVGIFRQAIGFVFGDGSGGAGGPQQVQQASIGGGVAAPILIGERLIFWYNSKRTAMRNKLYSAAFGPDTQANHLNQWGAFRDAWERSGRSRGQALAITLDGNASSPGTEHYEFHKAIDDFFDDYRRNGRFARERWTVDEYNKAARKGLRNAGLSRAEVNRAMLAIKTEQAEMKLKGNTRMRLIPSRVTPR